MIRPAEEVPVKGYIFDAKMEEEGDGRWSAWIEALPGCAAWGYSREEALEALEDAYDQSPAWHYRPRLDLVR